MDVGGSFLELSCVRIALVPVGAAMSDHRFEELTSHLTAFREIPVSALPRRTSVPRIAGNSTFSTMPSSFREAFNEASGSLPLLRSRSASRDIGNSISRTSAPGMKNHTGPLHGVRSTLSLPPSESRLSFDSSTAAKVHGVPASPTYTADLDLSSPEVDSSFRMRYDVVHRNHSGALIMKPFSEWDDFHSSKVWGVFGLVDCTSPVLCEDAEKRKLAIFDAYDDFSATLNNFKDACVRRLIVFTSQNAAQESGAFVLNDPKSPSQGNVDSPLHFSVGYVPERSKREETRLEVRAQIIHFAGLLLTSIDRDCWKRRESPSSELLLSPIDEKYTADRQSKLAKRRPGRLDKLIGDSMLLMGNPGEAISKYNSAIEKAKANSDRLWLAGAMEGWSAAHVLNHVGAGGSAGDRALTDRLIEHYAEIYKLYQKKRVAEPEAAAALRLAEFLGRWTNRRKDALDAAEHAATVGEGLRVQKRAALWEALARFSERMGCRRKAALFLYRLGLLNASQSVWSSAVALMIAAERQLSRNGRKPWADLNRRVLLTAAGHAEEAGDSHMAARLYVEALVTPQNPTSRREEDDAELIKLLSKAQVPPHLPAAQKVIRLEEISAIQSPSLSLRQRIDDDKGTTMESQVKDGPFIYNPFEAKKRAKEAAVARKSVTWVCGEPAQVSLRLNNSLGAEVALQIISVLFSGEGHAENNLSKISGEDGAGSRDTDVLEQEDVDLSTHTEYVRSLLKQSNKLAKTINETVTLSPSELRSGTLKHISIVPKRTGPLHVQGLLIQLFHGALVVLRGTKEVSAVNVIQSLPRVTLSTHIMDGMSMERNSSRTPLTVYSGEKRKFRVDVENTGTEPISWMRGTVNSSRPEALEVVSHEFGRSDIADSLETHGSSKSFVIEVLGKQPDDYANLDNDDADDIFLMYQPFSVVSITVEYEGKHSVGTIRESGLYVKVASMPAVTIGRADLLGYGAFPLDGYGKETSAQAVALEVRNMVAAPATVEVYPLTEPADQAAGNAEGVRGESYPLTLENCLVESGASTRVTAVLSSTIMNNLMALAAELQCAGEEGQKQSILRVKWKLPALGREGHWDISNHELWRMLFERAPLGESNRYLPLPLVCSGRRLTQATFAFEFDGPGLQKATEASGSNGVTIVRAGLFWRATVRITNISDTDLPPLSNLDVEVFGENERALTQDMRLGLIVGATEMVAVGSLGAESGTFEHSLHLRILSTGIFRLQACLYDASKDRHDNEDACTSRQGLSDSPVDTASEIREFPDDRGSPRQILSKTDGLSANREESVGERPEHMPSPNSRTATADAAYSDSHAAGTPRGLKRVGVTKRRKSWPGASASSGVVQPKTADSYPDLERRRKHSAVLACADVLVAVVDGTPVTLSGREFSSTQSLTSMPLAHLDHPTETANPNLDTIYH